MSIFITLVIETERLILRPLTMNDAHAVFEWTGDSRVTEYMIYPCHENIEVTKEWLGSLNNLENEYTWGFVRKSDNKLIGSGGIRLRPDENVWSFGYNLRYDCWGQGYATEASKRMIEYACSEHNAREFVAEHAVENTASGRVIQKCGLVFEGYSKYSKFDNGRTFRCKKYRMILK
ncbi:MAG: GNAT family N-acetyltransferase [Ruminococcus sp.]|nr:GNAT family N-acetyltransferase [Ruminococcus sp.]